MTNLQSWVLASRPKTLFAAIVPVLVGSACAMRSPAFRVLPAVAALVGAILIQIGTNFANDVFDYEKGADTEERLGPTRAVQAGLISAASMRLAMIGTFALAVLTGTYLVAIGGPWILAIGAASIASGVAYTGGPFPLGYHGLGDVFVFVFFGLVAVCGTEFVASGAVSPVGVAASVGVGALATAILVVNNYRDRQTDSRVGKRTLAVRFGPGFARVQFAVLLLVAFVVPVVVFALQLASLAVLLPLFALPLAALLFRRFVTREGAALNAVLAQTAALLLLYGVLLSVGIVV